MHNKYAIIFRRIAIACFVIPLLIGLICGLLVDKIPHDMIPFGTTIGIFLVELFLWLIAPFFLLLAIVVKDIAKAIQSQASIPLTKILGFIFSGIVMIMITIDVMIAFCKPDAFSGGPAILLPPLYTGLPGIVGYWTGWAVGILYSFFVRRETMAPRIKLYKVFISIILLIAVILTFNFFYQHYALISKIESSRTTPEELRKIFYRGLQAGSAYQIAYDLAKNKTCPPDILVRMSEIPDMGEHTAEKILANPNMSVEVLRNLSRQEDHNIRRMVAYNRLTPPDILDNLKNDSDMRVRYHLVENPNTSLETLRVLSNDKDSVVRENVASNSHTPPDILDNMKNDSEMRVRYFVTRNPNTSLETLRFLLNDKDYLVRGWADYQLKNRNNVVQEK